MASSLSTAAVRALTQSASPLAAACAPLLQRLSSLSGGAAAFSSSSSSCAPAAGGAASGGGGEPDAFTASLQHKTEEELRQLALKQGQPHTADAAEDSAAEGEQQEQELPPHGKREYGGYKGPEPTRYQDWNIKGRCSDF